MSLFDFLHHDKKHDYDETAQTQQTTSSPAVQDNEDDELDNVLSPSKKIDEEWQQLLDRAPHDESSKRLCLVAKFKDGRTARVDHFSISNTYAGLLEGSPAYASKHYWHDMQKLYTKRGNLLLQPTLVPSPFKDGWCLPIHKVQFSVCDVLDTLSVCCFVNTIPAIPVEEFINSITQDINFSEHCEEFEP